VSDLASSGLTVALVEPTSLMGRDVRAVLKERGFPARKIELYHSSPVSEGLVTADDEEAVYVAPLTADALEASQVAFFCGAAADTARFLPKRKDDALAIDLSGLRSGGPFAAPAQTEPLPAGNLFLTYDPTSAVVADLVRAIERVRPVAALTVAVDRPASELGLPALDELFQQAISLATFKSLPKDVHGTQSAFNFYRPDDTDAYDARVAEDVSRLLGRELPLAVLSARAGVFHGHHMRVEARFEGAAPTEAEVRSSLFGKGSEFEDVDPENLSGPVESAGRDETLVLGIRSTGSSLRVSLAADHLRRGGAVMAVRLAERALAERGTLAPVS
jgi:aspartate-semialdehyde dehydrogenase